MFLMFGQPKDTKILIGINRQHQNAPPGAIKAQIRPQPHKKPQIRVIKTV